MKPTTLFQIAQWSGGDLLRGKPSFPVTSLSTDTRSIQPGDVFVALKGENFDAHDHLKDAIDKGASALFVKDLPSSTENNACPIIRVKDTLTGLQEWARHYRLTLPMPIIGITGSSGKTSTKDFIRAVLSQKFHVNATAGNLNNHIGLPISILRTEADHTAGVFEMGMSHPGEIEVLAEIAQPTVGVITNIGVAHLEYMKTREAIALEKGMLAEAVPAGGFVILPAQDEFTAAIRTRTQATVITAGVDSGDVRATGLQFGMGKTAFKVTYQRASYDCEIPVAGEHMVRNATLAIATGLAVGMDLAEAVAGLSSTQLAGGRLQVREVAGIAFLDDSYNANPESMAAALRTLHSLPVTGKRIAILGRMAELGESAEAEHIALGKRAVETEMDLVLTIGEEGKQIAAGTRGQVETHVFPGHAELATYLKAVYTPGDLVLLKGSRSSKMEAILTHLSPDPSA